MKAIVEDYIGSIPAGATSGEIVDGVHFYAGVRCPLPDGSGKEHAARRVYKWAVETAIYASLFKPAPPEAGQKEYKRKGEIK